MESMDDVEFRSEVDAHTTDTLRCSALPSICDPLLTGLKPELQPFKRGCRRGVPVERRVIRVAVGTKLGRHSVAVCGHAVDAVIAFPVADDETLMGSLIYAIQIQGK